MSERGKDVVAVITLLFGFLAAVALAVWAFLLGFCGLFGEECTTSEENAIGLFTLAPLGVFVSVPVAVAAWRRQARWLLAPLIEVALIVGLFGVIAWF